MIGKNDNEESDNDISKMTARELKEICRTCNLPVSGNKQALISRIVPCMQALRDMNAKEQNINENVDADVEHMGI